MKKSHGHTQSNLDLKKVATSLLGAVYNPRCFRVRHNDLDKSTHCNLSIYNDHNSLICSQRQTGKVRLI